ncbi:hypothetical protein WJX81_004160 [Elliptochloris bilobata]|uniref:STI1 domain-containing protein n=1 Tax=Elliptochloris bilobata TaxID=381761 RepID=A0AAW1RX15_9CHLO
MKKLSLGSGRKHLSKTSRTTSEQQAARGRDAERREQQERGQQQEPMYASESVEVVQDAPNAGEHPVPPPPPSYQQYYQGYPPQYMPLPPPPEPAPAAGGVPAFVWVGVGVLLALAWGKVASLFSFFRGSGGGGGGGGGAQEKMMGWAMQQMMEQAQKGGGASGGASPFPPGIPGAGGFPAGFPGVPGAGGSPFPAFDTTAKPAGPPGAPASTSEPAGGSANGDARRGARFEEMRARERGREQAATGAASAPAAGGGFSAAPEAPARPPTGPVQKAASFVDVDEEEASTSGAGSYGAGPVADAGGSGFSADMLDNFFRDPAMQQLLYKHLPEPMRNPQTFEWMLSNPEYRSQLENIMQQQGFNMNPEMMQMMKDFDATEMNKQLDSLGLSPTEVINRIMAEPDLAAAFQKPKVMQAIMESQQNPMAIMKYQDDPDVMMVFEKMATMFPNQAAAAPMGGEQ